VKKVRTTFFTTLLRLEVRRSLLQRRRRPIAALEAQAERRMPAAIEREAQHEEAPRDQA